MTDWSDELNAALASGDIERMKATLDHIPQTVLQRAVPYLDQLAQDSERGGRWQEALTYRDQRVRATPDQAEPLCARARTRLSLGQYTEALADAQRAGELEPGRAAAYRLQGEAYENLNQPSHALASYREALRLKPGDETLSEHAHSLERELDATGPGRRASQDPSQDTPSASPEFRFDPALLDDPAMPESYEGFRIEALQKHLWRYSAQQSPRNILARLEDPVWLEAWDTALSTVEGAQVMFWGSELGVLGLRALEHGAEAVRCVEPYPLDARITTGIIQKNLLTRWHNQHGANVQNWSEEARRESFEAFAKDIQVVADDNDQTDPMSPDVFALPRIDHSLLGTGIISALHRYLAGAPATSVRVIPARARIHAMAIQWRYPDTHFDLRPLNSSRWTPYPDILDLDETFWTSLTRPMQVGEIHFREFAETTWTVKLPVETGGNVDAIVYWFDLDLGHTWISNAPGSELNCIKPAVQFTDPIEVRQNTTLTIKIHVHETRLHFRTDPPTTQCRSHSLPRWYVPMLCDQHRNTAYRAALERALTNQGPANTVLNISAGCGLLSLMAASTGATRVVGCEVQPGIHRIGRAVVADNGLDDRITLVNKDCRQMSVPEHMDRRADLAVFELFDCSLIGEGLLHFLAHARDHLLTEDARYLPAAATIRAMVIEYRLEAIRGVDVNLLNPYRASPGFINVDANRLDYRALTEPFDVFEFDFAEAGADAQEHPLNLPVVTPGTAGAVLFWFDLKLDEATQLSNAPGAHRAGHWKQGLHFLPEVSVDTSTPLPLMASHNGSNLQFRWQSEKLPKSAFSTLPRLDPRWVAASNELEQQTQGLLQHCAQNPAEQAKVMEIAKRFAVDPAAHALDPLIAQRFLQMFTQH